VATSGAGGADPASIGTPPPFSAAWLAAVEPLVVGVRVPDCPGRRTVELVCTDGERVRPWSIHLSDGFIVGLEHRPAADAPLAIVHSVTVGWRLLGLSVRGSHRLDELGIEQVGDTGSDRHPIPPLDESSLDLSNRNHPSVIDWHERVIDSPLGTIFVSRRLAGGRLSICGASTRPLPSTSGVGSDIPWCDVMAARRFVSFVDPSRRRVWRGPERDIRTIRAALSHESHTGRFDPARTGRDAYLTRTLGVFEEMRAVLRSDARWRALWRPGTGVADP
jgi:hypothetical protein